MTNLADRLRIEFADRTQIAEIRMFGGVCFMLDGNMLVCSMKDGSLLVRVGDARQADMLKRPGTARMAMGERQMKGYVVVDPSALNDVALKEWIAAARSFVTTLPPKKKT